MRWFSETPWPPIFVCLAGATLLLLSWRSRGKTPLLIGGLGVLFLCPVIYIVEVLWVTEPEEVEQRLQQLADAVAGNDAEKTLGFFARDEQIADEEQRSRMSGVRTGVALGMSRVKFTSNVRVSNVTARYTNDQSAVSVQFRAGADLEDRGTGYGRRFPTHWQTTWKKFDGKWLIVDLRRLAWDSDREIDLLSDE